MPPPLSDHTAVLRTCRRLHAEGRDLIAPNVTLHCSSAVLMWEYLLRHVPAAVLPRLRRGSVAALLRHPAYPRTGRVQWPPGTLTGVMHAFPGLCLDRLYVDGINPTPSNVTTRQMADVQEMATSRGWRELHYVVALDGALGDAPSLDAVVTFAREGVVLGREDDPHWERLYEPLRLDDKEVRTLLRGEGPASSEGEGSASSEGAGLAPSKRDARRVRFVVRRGRGAEYQVLSGLMPDTLSE